MRKAITLFAACAAFASAGLVAQEAAEGEYDPFAAEDELFADFGVVDASSPEAAPTAPSSNKADESFLWKGDFSGSASMVARWGDAEGMDLWAADSSTLSMGASAKIGFDAWPSADFRVSGSFKLAYPFETRFEAAKVGNVNTPVTANVPSLKVFELFSDFNWDNRLFFRFGKQRIKWGEGYFFSPADVLSLTKIDPTDPEAEREGPLALTLHYPIVFIGDLWFHAAALEGELAFDKIALALRTEWVLGTAEIGIGAFYRGDMAPRGYVTANWGVGDFTLLGEGVLLYGSDKLRVSSVAPSMSNNPLGVEIAKVDSEFSFQGTLGFLWNDSESKLTAAAQYLYQSDGNADGALLDKALKVFGIQQSGATSPYASMEKLSPRDVTMWGQHYAALMLSASELFGTKLSASIIAYANLADLSGWIIPRLSYKLFDRATVSLSANYTFGDDGDEFALLAQNKNPLSVSLGFSLGSGSF
jgi:hypothetical protein